jgi:hypothetical protein
LFRIADHHSVKQETWNGIETPARARFVVQNSVSEAKDWSRLGSLISLAHFGDQRVDLLLEYFYWQNRELTDITANGGQAVSPGAVSTDEERCL